MTAYFDELGREVGQMVHLSAKETTPAQRDRLRAIEETLVYDVLVCSEWPKFPLGIRDRIQRSILRHGVETLPPRMTNETVNSWPDHVRAIWALVGELHTIFHDLADLGLPEFTDKPTTPLRRMAAMGAERLSDMADRIRKGQAESLDHGEEITTT